MTQTRWGQSDELARLTNDELYQRARAAGIRGRSTMSKDQPIGALWARQEWLS
jgi:hypothetical protein